MTTLKVIAAKIKEFFMSFFEPHVDLENDHVINKPIEGGSIVVDDDSTGDDSIVEDVSIDDNVVKADLVVKADIVEADSIVEADIVEVDDDDEDDIVEADAEAYIAIEPFTLIPMSSLYPSLKTVLIDDGELVFSKLTEVIAKPRGESSIVLIDDGEMVFEEFTDTAYQGAYVIPQSLPSHVADPELITPHSPIPTNAPNPDIFDVDPQEKIEASKMLHTNR